MLGGKWHIIKISFYEATLAQIFCTQTIFSRIICGLTAFTTKQHIIRASLEAVCFQTRDILEAMYKDCGFPLTKLNTDGKMSTNNLLMQLQADLCGTPVCKYTLLNVLRGTDGHTNQYSAYINSQVNDAGYYGIGRCNGSRSRGGYRCVAT